MTFHTFLIKYGEIGIKGKNRYLFEDALVNQIKFALKDVDGEFDVYKTQGRIYVDCSEFYDYEMKTIKDDTVDIQTTNGEFDSLKNIVLTIAEKLDIKGYAKIDFRKKDDKYYLIEVNSQVSFHPTGEFITCAKTDGYSIDDIINYIVEKALETNSKKNSIGYKVIDNDR